VQKDGQTDRQTDRHDQFVWMVHKKWLETTDSITDGELFLLQVRSRSSASLKAVTDASRTVLTARSIHTFTRPTSRTTAGCRGATRVIRTPARCGNT